jgi:poly(A) polymerase
MQPRLERRTVSSAPGLIDQPRFRAGFDFLRLRADVDEVPQELAEWWEDYSLGTEDEREALLQALKASQTRRVPASRARPDGARPARAPAAAPSVEADVPSASETDDTESPDRRRRRRRRRGGRGAGAGEGSGGGDASGTGTPGGSGTSGGSSGGSSGT